MEKNKTQLSMKLQGGIGNLKPYFCFIHSLYVDMKLWAHRSGFVLTAMHRPETFSEKTFLQVTQHFSFLKWINVQTLLWQT